MIPGSYILAARPRSHVATVTLYAGVERLAPERMCLAVCSMLHSGRRDPIDYGVAVVCKRAAKTLPLLSESARRRALDVTMVIHDRVAALPEDDRVSVVLALAYHWHESSPVSQVWRDVARALDALQRHGAHTITDEHETTAQRIAREVLG